jgi:CheY-like chemotaxis protein
VGSTFWFVIPFHRAGASVIDRDTIPGHFKNLKVLIVDDIQINLEIMKRQLKAFEIEAGTVDDGFAVLAELERAWHKGRPYDLVFLDQMMPGLSGAALAARIRATPSLAETKLVIVSSAGRDSIAEKELKLEAVLEKPVRYQELLDTLTNIYNAMHHEAPALKPEAKAAAGQGRGDRAVPPLAHPSGRRQQDQPAICLLPAFQGGPCRDDGGKRPSGGGCAARK